MASGALDCFIKVNIYWGFKKSKYEMREIIEINVYKLIDISCRYR